MSGENGENGENGESGESGTMAILGEILLEVMRDDAPAADAITRDTIFSEDLEMESLEFVVFAERVKERFGERVDFVGWLSAKSLDEILKLRMGDLVDMIDASLAGAGEQGSPGEPGSPRTSDEPGEPGEPGA